MTDFFIRKKSQITFHELMPNRIHEILLVASQYDAFILEEDGHLTEQILTEYIGMNFNYSPRVTHVSTAQESFKIMSKKKFDLIIVMVRIADLDPISFGTAIKKKYPKKPVILLAFDESEIKQIPIKITRESINRTFIWSGDASVFTAIIKYVEDKINASKDIIDSDIRAILIIEDSPRMYSKILPFIYKEIVFQVKHLMKKNLSLSQKILYLRGRPKVLLTTNYEGAKRLMKKYQQNIIGVISDVKFPRKNLLDETAGFKFTQWVLKKDPSMPLVLQSNNLINKKKANELRIDFLDKNSNTFFKDLRLHIAKNFGFGDFIFSLPNNRKIKPAKSIKELISAIKTVPIESIIYHAKSHHFSNWLAARTKFNLASKLRSIQANKFKNKESIRTYILNELEKDNNKIKKTIINSIPKDYDDNNLNFYRLCGGSLGGKARGLAFINSLLNESKIEEEFKELKVSIPQCAVIGTNEFDKFMSYNNLWEIALVTDNEQKLKEYFLKAKLSNKLKSQLKKYLSLNKCPISVRSSSLLEDSQYKSLAGSFDTFMLPNNSNSDVERLKELTNAIRLVFASMFKSSGKVLIKNTGHNIEEEKMAVIIQHISGKKYKSNRFYPTFSGVIKGINYYPFSYMNRNEGIMYLALGFGRTIVNGEKCLAVSPKYPNIIPQFHSAASIKESTQNQFYALKLDGKHNINDDLDIYSLDDAEKDLSLKWIGSVISHEDNQLRDSLLSKGTRVVSFASILKWNTFPLSKLVARLLYLGKSSLGCDVEIEFSVNLSKTNKPEFNILQIKPMSNIGTNLKKQKVNRNMIFSKSNHSLGHGTYKGIKDLIIVRSQTFSPLKSEEIALEIASINKQFLNDRHYIICGPGRWGSSDHWLGIPVTWKQISQASVFMEVGRDDLPVEPSFGSHFFQNLTSMNKAYLTINQKSNSDFLNLKWIEKNEHFKKYDYIDHYKFKYPLVTKIDGNSGLGVIQMPIDRNDQGMNESESSGI